MRDYKATSGLSVFLLWLLWSHLSSAASPAPLHCFAGSVVLSYAFVRDLEEAAEYFVLGRRKCFVQLKRKIFLILFFFPCFIGKNLQQCNFNFAKTHFGREVGEQKTDMKCCLLAVAHGLCSPLRGCGSSLPRLVQCCTRSKCCTVSPVPTQPFPVSSLCGGQSLRLRTEFLFPSTTWLLGFRLFKTCFIGPAPASPAAL